VTSIADAAVSTSLTQSLFPGYIFAAMHTLSPEISSIRSFIVLSAFSSVSRRPVNLLLPQLRRFNADEQESPGERRGQIRMISLRNLQRQAEISEAHFLEWSYQGRRR
jgi:transcription antitermination factor NusG